MPTVSVHVTRRRSSWSAPPGVGHVGHASVDYAIALGRECGAGTVVLFHHAPDRDAELDLLCEVYRISAPTVVIAVQRASLDLPT